VSAGEPALTPSIVARGCVLARWRGYSLTAPNLDGAKAVRAPATYINASHLACRLP
jgi:hypothetical protein